MSEAQSYHFCDVKNSWDIQQSYVALGDIWEKLKDESICISTKNELLALYLDTQNISFGSSYDNLYRQIVENYIRKNNYDVHIDLQSDDFYLFSRKITYENGFFEKWYTYQLYLENGVNKFSEFMEQWFSSKMRDFIEHDLFHDLCVPEFSCDEQTFERLKNLCLFVMDIETTEGTQLENGQSSASGYFHFLNQPNGRNDTNGDGIPEWNTIDTTLRYAAEFYNTPYNENIISDQAKADIANARENNEDIAADARESSILQNPENINLEYTPNALWVKELWNYNGQDGRNGDEYLFEDQMRLFLMRIYWYSPESRKALTVILSGSWDQRNAAKTIYEAHHGGIYDTNGGIKDEQTYNRMLKYLDGDEGSQIVWYYW
jgi:hypothetical protein